MGRIINEADRTEWVLKRPVPSDAMAFPYNAVPGTRAVVIKE